MQVVLMACATVVGDNTATTANAAGAPAKARALMMAFSGRKKKAIDNPFLF